VTTTREHYTPDRLLDLLPAVYRIRDAETAGVLRELLGVLAEQAEVVSEELAQLYDDQFIETCARWVAPYIGDLIGYRVLHGVVPEVASPRAEVANTIAYRRRKGTASVLEQLAYDVTGWPARVVEFFERLATTQYMNHPRPEALATVDVRDHEALSWVGALSGGFDDLAHTGEVRRIAAPRPAAAGRYNIPNVGIFLWRTEAVQVTGSPLVEHGERRRFRFDPLGCDVPLFGLPRTEPEITHLAQPYDVPLPLARRWLHDHVADYYGLRADHSLLVARQSAGSDPIPVAAKDVRICDLSDVPGGGGAWAHEPAAGAVAIDPVLGRVYLGTALPAGRRLVGTFCVGMAVPVGAGATSRAPTPSPEPTVSAGGGVALQPLLDQVRGGGTVEITDSDRYQGSITVATDAAPPGAPDTETHLVAADRTRPLVAVGTAVRLDLAASSTVVLDGLLVAGGPLVLDEVGDSETRTVILRNCTLVPGHERTQDGRPRRPTRASLQVLDPFAQVRLERCVTGPVVAVEGVTVEVVDSVIDASGQEGVAFCGRASTGGLRTVSSVADMEVGDGTEVGGGLDLAASTVVGGVHATRLDASNSLLVAELSPGDPRPAAVWARRRQLGCVRYSFVPEGSRTGRRYRCQPDPDDPAGVRRATAPHFTSMRYGDPAYLQLATSTPDAIRRGADDESEMGATHQLYTPQREANLLLRLDEYLRFGLEAGIFYAT
jgi:hypothetical protein